MQSAALFLNTMEKYQRIIELCRSRKKTKQCGKRGEVWGLARWITVDIYV